MNEDKMLQIEDKIKDIEGQIEFLYKSHRSNIEELKQIRELYSKKWEGLNAENILLHLENKGD